MKHSPAKLEWQRKRTARLKEKYRLRNPGKEPLRMVAIGPKRRKEVA